MSTQLGATSTQSQAHLNPREQGTAHVRFESAVIQSVDHLNQIAADPANAGRTFQVTKEVFDYFYQRIRFFPRPTGDIERINRLLGTEFDENEPGGMTRSCVCQNCGHEFSFADHVESALRMGVHTADELRYILAGDKFFLTVDTDKPREVLCLNCEQKSFVPHCCYGTRDYAYVEPE